MSVAAAQPIDLSSTPSPVIAPDGQRDAIINMEDRKEGITYELETIRRRLGDIAACKSILHKTKANLITASESLHLDAGDLAEFERIKAFIAALMPLVERADVNAKEACTVAIELLRNLKAFASQMLACPPLSELKQPGTEYILSTSMAPFLSQVQATTKEAIAVLEDPAKEILALKARANRVLRIIFFGCTGFLVLLSLMGRPLHGAIFGSVVLFIGVMAFYNRNECIRVKSGALIPIPIVDLEMKRQKSALATGEKEKAIRKDTNAGLKRAQLISTHISNLRIPERINAELAKGKPFGLASASEAWMKVGDDLEETINTLEGSQ